MVNYFLFLKNYKCNKIFGFNKIIRYRIQFFYFEVYVDGNYVWEILLYVWDVVVLNYVFIVNIRILWFDFDVSFF